jgi:hypothetical protein
MNSLRIRLRSARVKTWGMIGHQIVCSARIMAPLRCSPVLQMLSRCQPARYPARRALTRRGLIVSNSRHDTLQDRMTMVTTSCFVLLDVGP